MDLRNCFEDTHENLNDACNKWISILNGLIKKLKNNPELEELFEKKQELKTFLVTHENSDELYQEKSDNLEKVIENIATLCAQKNKETV